MCVHIYTHNVSLLQHLLGEELEGIKTKMYFTTLMCSDLAD